MMALYYLKNILEILFFSGIIYFFSLWLKKDKRANLLFYFYAYAVIFSVTYFLNLSTIHLFLLYSSPFALLLFILLHQETLQRNFVTFTTSPSMTCTNNETWIENLIRICLHHMNNNVFLFVVIENQSDLKPFIHSNYLLQSPLSLELLLLVTESPHFDKGKLLWCTSNGKLVGVNSSWQLLTSLHGLPSIPTWQQEALLMTLKTDTIVFKVNPANRCFEVILKGTLYETINAHQIVPFIKKNLYSNNRTHSNGEIQYDNPNLVKKQPAQQPHH